jgi:hypothetical protein
MTKIYNHTAMLLVGSLLLGGCNWFEHHTSQETNSQVVTDTNDTQNIKVVISDIPTQRIKYPYITLKAQSDTNVTLKVLNQTLQQEQNRTIYTKGYKQPNTNEWYFYDIPLVAGENNLLVVASDSYIKEIHISSDANETLPLRVQSDTYRGIQELKATLKVDTLVDVDEVYWDIDGDGVIDQKVKPTTYQEQNLTIYTSSLSTHYTKEGRYHPRVTLQTKDGLLFSSQDVALSLDVVRDKDQKDPKGAEPMDVAKEFQRAILDDDRAKVEKLVGGNPNLIHLLYDNPHALPLLKDIYSSIKTWDEKKWDMDGRASISYTFEINGTTYGGGMELMVANPQIDTGRNWIVDFIY